MNQQNEGSSSVPPAELPVKRKRGRPRKEESPQERNSTARPGPDGVRNTQHVQVAPSDKCDQSMVGMMVSGVVEGSFDAGYFLSVKVGDNDTVLRGVVFQPGRFVPVSEANDVAPTARMYKRRNVPIPFNNQATPSPNPISQFKPNNDRPAQASMVPSLVPSRFSPGTSFSFLKQPASVAGCSSSSFVNNNAGIPLDGTGILQKTGNLEHSSHQVLPLKFPSDHPLALRNSQSTLAAVTVNDNLPNNDLLLGKNVLPQKVIGPKLENTQTSRLDCNMSSEQIKGSQNAEVPRLKQDPMKVAETTKAFSLDLSSTGAVQDVEKSVDDMEVSKELSLDIASKPVVPEQNVMQDSKASPPKEGSSMEMGTVNNLNLDLSSTMLPVQEVDMMQNTESSPGGEGSKIGKEARKDLNLDLASKPVANQWEVNQNVIVADQESKVTTSNLTSKPDTAEHNIMEFKALPLIGGPEVDMEKGKGENVELHKVVQGIDSPSVAERTIVFMEARKELQLESAPKKTICNKAVNWDTAVQVQDDGHEMKAAESVKADIKIPNLELQLTSESNSVSPVAAGIMVGTKDPAPTTTDLDLQNKSSRAVTPEYGTPACDAAKNNEEGVPKTNDAMDIQDKATLSEGEVPLAVQTPSRISASSDVTENMYCIPKDAVSSPQHGRSISSSASAGNGDCTGN